MWWRLQLARCREWKWEVQGPIPAERRIRRTPRQTGLHLPVQTENCSWGRTWSSWVQALLYRMCARDGEWVCWCPLSSVSKAADRSRRICQSCYYQLRQIRTVRHSLTSSAIQTLVHAFICTRVDFSNSLLYGTSAYLLDRLQSVLNSAARLILRIGKYDPISAAIRRDLHWLPVPFRIRYKLNSITSNCLAGRAPEYLIELCHSVTDIPARRNLRSSSRVQLLVPRYRKERSGKRGFSVSSPQLWNLLPADIRLLHNEHQLFRKRLKTHYMQQSMLCHWGSMSTVWTLLLLLLLLLLLGDFEISCLRRSRYRSGAEGGPSLWSGLYNRRTGCCWKSESCLRERLYSDYIVSSFDLTFPRTLFLPDQMRK